MVPFKWNPPPPVAGSGTGYKPYLVYLLWIESQQRDYFVNICKNPSNAADSCVLPSPRNKGLEWQDPSQTNVSQDSLQSGEKNFFQRGNGAGKQRDDAWVSRFNSTE